MNLFALVFFLILVASFNISNAETVNYNEEDRTIVDYLLVDPEDISYDGVCTPRPLLVVYGESLKEPALEARYHYVKRVGQDNGLLIEFDKPCEALQYGIGANAALKNRCVGSRVSIEGEAVCRVENLYRVPNKLGAQATALRLQVERARASGLALPEDPVYAARDYLKQVSNN